LTQESNNHVLKCHHCGNKTLMKELTNHREDGIENVYVAGGRIEIRFFNVWSLYLCPVCENETLIKRGGNSEDVDMETMSFNIVETVIYPQMTISNDSIPKKVRNSFEAALRIKNIEGTLCAIGIRRTLEMMCKDKNASGKDLFRKLQSLANNGTLPPIINDMATLLRVLGNEAAHGNDVEFTDDVIDSMINFTHAILDYVYILPDKLSNIQDHLGKKVKNEVTDAIR